METSAAAASGASTDGASPIKKLRSASEIADEEAEEDTLLMEIHINAETRIKIWKLFSLIDATGDGYIVSPRSSSATPSPSHSRALFSRFDRHSRTFPQRRHIGIARHQSAGQC